MNKKLFIKTLALSIIVLGTVFLAGNTIPAAPPKKKILKVLVDDPRGISVTIIKDLSTSTLDTSKGVYIPELDQVVLDTTASIASDSIILP